jgi:hypothetical protein
VITVGRKEKFAFELGPQCGQMKHIAVWIAGQNLSSYDYFAYLPGFLAALNATAAKLKLNPNHRQYEGEFLGLGVEAAFIQLRDANSSALERAWAGLRFADWGPTTDDFLCFLLPLNGHLYIACQRSELDEIHCEQVTPYELFQTIESAIHEVTKESVA